MFGKCGQVIKIDGVNIQEVSTVKYLGVTFDSNLIWKNHVNELCLKLSKTVDIFSKLGTMFMLIYCFTIPFLTYVIQVWGLTSPNYLKPLTTLQKRVVRIMTFSDPRSHSEPLLKTLRLLKFSDIIHLEILSFVYQWYHKLRPSCFVNYFNPVSSIHSYNTRHSQIDNLFVKSVHATQYGIPSLSYTGPKLWNSLSIDVKKIKPFSSFRQHIKNSVIDGYNYTIIDS